MSPKSWFSAVAACAAAFVSFTSRAELLPDGYVKIEYIESAGNHMIDTGYKPNPKTVVEMSIQLTGSWGQFVPNKKAKDSACKYILGCLDTAGNESFSSNMSNFDPSAANNGLSYSVTCWMNGTSSYKEAGSGAMTISASADIFSTRNTYLIDGTTGTFSLGSATKTDATKKKTTTQERSLALIGRIYGSGAGTMEPFRLYGMRIYSVTIREDGEAKREFVPAYEKATGKAGLYDLAGRSFYANVYDKKPNFVFELPHFDRLSVTGAPDEAGTVTPGYGDHDGYAEGDVVTCTAPESVTNDAKTVEWTCVGCTVRTNDAVYLQAAFTEPGQRTVAFEFPNCSSGAALEWQWRKRQSVPVASDGNCEVAVSGDGLFAAGDIVTLTVTPNDGYAFGRWTGVGLDGQHRFDNPYKFVMGDTPPVLTANVRKVVYVAKNGNDENGGTSWGDALATFKAAINKVPNAYVLVGEGVYNVSTAVNVTNGVTICGSGTRGTVVKLSEKPSKAGDAIRSVFYVRHTGARLTNLALTTGGSARGRGAYLSNGQIDNCSITNCVTVNGDMNGGGLYVVSGVVRNCLVQHNEANSSGGSNMQGGGIWMSDGLVESCTIRDNYAAYSWGAGDGSGCGGGVWMKGGTLRNCLVTLNRTTGNASGRGKGAGVYAEGSALVENSTIVKNRYSGTLSLTGGMTASGSSVTVRNTIIQLNENDSGVSNFTRGSAKLENVNSTSTGVEGIFNGDPAFVNAENGDWHIGYGSCVDIGEIDDWMRISTDLDGKARVFGDKVDCGCYEFVLNGLSCGFDATTDGALDVAEVTLTGSVVGADPEDVTFAWKVVDSTGKVTERSGKGLSEVVLSMPAGFYSVTLSVSDGVSSDEISRDNAFSVFARDIYVDLAGANSLPYADFASAATNLADALKLAAGGSVVHLADGVHYVSEPLVLTKGIVVTHDGAREDCIVTGNTGDFVFRVDNSKARLENVDICGIYPRLVEDGRTGSYRTGSYQTKNGLRIGVNGGTVTNCIVESCYGETHGAGVAMSGGTLVDSIIRGNLAYSTGGAGYAGGGLDMDGGLADRCVITNNLTTYGSVSAGGGVRVAGSGVLRNSLIAYNYSSGEGGGARVMGSGKMENCTVVGNTAKGEGAAGVNAFLDYPSAHPQVVNTIIWGNTNTTDKVLHETSGTASAYDTCWTEDPVFRRGRTSWRLRSASPCRDTAKKLDWMDDAVDLYGNPRIRYGLPDIGAVESENDPGLMIMVR